LRQKIKIKYYQYFQIFVGTIIQHHFKILSPDFLQMVIHPAIGFVNFDNADQIKGSADDRRITFGSVNSGPKII
jgi:hypothetical protein